jgi:hypothetical protein
MLSFLTRRLVLELEMSSGTLRLAVVSGGGLKTTVLSVKMVGLPAGLGNQNYATPSI